MFSLIGLRLYFPALEPWCPPFVPVYLCANVGARGLLPTTLPAPFSATLSLALSVYPCVNVGPQGLLVARLPARWSHTPTVSVPPQQCESSLPRLPVSAPPTGLDECLFFYLLGVGLPCCSIFCQFWLCEEAQCVYLCLHLGSPALTELFMVYIPNSLSGLSTSTLAVQIQHVQNRICELFHKLFFFWCFLPQ